ncbi:hypothetical protein, partial [Serratia sp. 506_PEND]
MANRTQYQPWNDIDTAKPDFPCDMTANIRMSAPLFTRLPAVGEWFQGLGNGERLEVVAYFQAERIAHLNCLTRCGTFKTFRLADFVQQHRPLMRNAIIDAPRVTDGHTPRQLLAAHQLANTTLHDMATAQEMCHGRWLTVYRRLKIHGLPTAGRNVNRCP